MSLNPNTSRKPARVDDGKDGDGPTDTKNVPTCTSSTRSSVQQDKDVWYSDGNIVIIAENQVAFRVHKGILAQRSEVFNDMFSLLNADTATTKTFDGCPVVEVDDAPKDIRRFLLVICCGKNYYYRQDLMLPVPLEVLASLIRMAHKYIVRDVLDDALSRLKKYYTNDLVAWQDSCTRARYVSAEDADAPTVIQLARLTDTPSLLPTAFLACTELMTEYSANPDGSFEYPAASLSVPDQACATRALVLLSAAPSAGCMTRGICSRAREAPLDELQMDSGMVMPITDDNAFYPLAERLWEGPSGWHLFCESCQQTLQETDASEMKRLRQNLPIRFDLDIDENSWPSGEA